MLLFFSIYCQSDAILKLLWHACSLGLTPNLISSMIMNSFFFQLDLFGSRFSASTTTPKCIFRLHTFLDKCQVFSEFSNLKFCCFGDQLSPSSSRLVSNWNILFLGLYIQALSPGCFTRFGSSENTGMPAASKISFFPRPPCQDMFFFIYNTVWPRTILIKVRKPRQRLLQH